MKKHTRIPLVICSLITAQAASGATLAFYDINDGGTNTDILGVESSLSGVNTTSLSLTGTGVSSSTNSDTIFVRFSDASSATGSSYIEFTLTPANVGQTLSLTSLSFEYYYDGSDSSSSGDAFWDLTANINGAGFADVGANPDATYSSATNTVPSTLPSETVILGQTNVTSAVFRLSMYDDGGNASNTFIKTNSITVTGDVVPEPCTALLGVLGLAGFLIRRRR